MSNEFPFEIEHQPGTVIDWYLERMKASGITKAVATKCGFKLGFDDQGAHFTVPYFTIDGVETLFQRQRNREEQMVREAGVSGGNFKGKYTQKKGSKNHLYWPPLYNQRTLYNDPSVPIIVCEGELKAVAAQMAVAASGLPALIVGVPGTRLCTTVEDELKNINCMAPNAARTVYLAMDWGGKGKSKENSLEMEFALRRTFQALGARVVLLRWAAPEGSGEQKLDDWLVAGGDISAALTESLRTSEAVDSEFQQVWDYLNAHYAICHGQYIPLSNMTKKYTPANLCTMEPSKSIMVSAKKSLGPDAVWSRQPPEDRNVVDGYTFLPAPLGQEPERYVWDDGVRLLNTAPRPQWLSDPWENEVSADTIAPFMRLLERLCQDGAPWFLQFLAHCAQHPAERGPHVIIFKDDGGTGKSILFETLDLVFGKYSGPIGNCLTSSFNAELEHLVIAWWSDPVIHGANDRDLESALKNFSGDSKLTINHKGGAKYTVRNYGRLLIATNKDWIVPVNSKERRYTVFGGLCPLAHTEAREYMHWLHAGGIEKVRQYLASVELTIDIKHPGPRTEQRAEMERVSAPPLQRLLESELFEDREIWTAEQIRQIYTDQTGRKLSVDQIGKDLAKMGCIKKKVRVDSDTPRLWAIRRPEYWDAAAPKEWADEYKGRKF